MLSCHLIIEPDILARQLQDLVFLTLTTKIVFGQPTKECRVGESGGDWGVVSKTATKTR